MLTRYAHPTEIIPGATGAPPPDDPVDLSGPMPDLRGSMCIGSTAEWVPDHEANTVPAELADMCLACDGRERCLLWACLTDQSGYWAATTTQARRLALVAGDIADLLEHPSVAARSTMHPVGAGTIYSYRSGCDCDECRAANARAKAAQRSRAKERRKAVLAAGAISAA